jgi:hypothetical protein
MRARNRAARLQRSGCSERRILPDPNCALPRQQLRDRSTTNQSHNFRGDGRGHGRASLQRAGVPENVAGQRLRILNTRTHTASAKRIGITEEQIRALVFYQRSTLFDEKDKAVTTGAFILFPGRQWPGKVFVRKPPLPKRGVGFPSVGAFSLRPGESRQRQYLRAFLSRAIRLLASRTEYQEETGIAPK